ncbi:unnamed protein product, partial [Urochloa humidicola]
LGGFLGGHGGDGDGEAATEARRTTRCGGGGMELFSSEGGYKKRGAIWIRIDKKRGGLAPFLYYFFPLGFSVV